MFLFQNPEEDAWANAQGLDCDSRVILLGYRNIRMLAEYLHSILLRLDSRRMKLLEQIEPKSKLNNSALRSEATWLGQTCLIAGERNLQYDDWIKTLEKPLD